MKLIYNNLLEGEIFFDSGMETTRAVNIHLFHKS